MYSDTEEYVRAVREAADTALPWDSLRDANIFMTGATGLIGTFLVDLLLWQNDHAGLGCQIYAVGRSQSHAVAHFGASLDRDDLSFLCWDVNDATLPSVQADYVIHAASNTHPRAYASDPIGTIMTNLLGLRNVLDYARKTQAKRVLFLSSVEIYGKSRKATDVFDESYCGYIDCNTLRAGYNEGKRAGEALCQAYRAQYGLDIVIPRLSRIYGPTMRRDDSKAMAQFLRNALQKQDIVLKSAGTQRFSYTYVPDAVTGLFACLLLGHDGEAYNIADFGSLSLREIAEVIATAAGTKVVFEIPDAAEAKGYSTADVALLDTNKIQQLGWQPQYDEEKGITHCLACLRQMANE